jgi:alpha-mannosidase
MPLPTSRNRLHPCLKALRACIALILALAVGLALAGPASAAPKRVFLAPDDHTDYFWTATDVEYRQFFQTMLDYYVNQADATAHEAPEHQSRFSTDGSLWLWEYEKHKTHGEFHRLVEKLKSGHLSVPKNPLVITYGGVPAEGVLRSMYYSGQLERRYGVESPLAIAMENAGMSYGLGALWAGSGALYSWKGVCNCPSLVPNLDNREHEIYDWIGPDGSRLLMKWNSLHDPSDNMSIGGYAEARFPRDVLDLVTTQAAANGFAARWPYDTIGMVGQGQDDQLTTNLNIQQACKTDTDPNRTCIVSNTTDFFEEFDARYGATLPTVSASFGNEWDLAPASMAEVSARVKRSMERLRTAEALATLVSLVDPSFLDGRQDARDRAFLNMGLYFEHDFEEGGPRVPASARIGWQRQVATQIEGYVDDLLADATDTMGALIQRSGTQPRVFVFNPLSWARTDVADIRYTGSLPAHVIDVTTGAEVPSQAVTLGGLAYLRVVVPGVPSVGYKVLEIRAGAGQVFGNGPTASASTGVIENEAYRIVVSPRGAITSFIDKRMGDRQFAGNIGGFAMNDLGASSGSLQIENAGPVSVTLLATAPSPLAHRTRVTLFRGSDRVEIHNEVTQNFGGTRLWKFSFNLTSPDVRHEEVGAITRARLTTAGGHYSPRNARYDFLTLNHFADMTGAGPAGVTLSNADAYFMQVGSSSVSNLDTTTPQLSVLLGGSLRPYNPIQNQAGDSFFRQRFALRSHGAYDQAAAMRFALEHQNPLAVGAVTGGGNAYPGSSHSFLSISDPNVLLWALKPAEEGIAAGVIARVWNVTDAARSFSLSLDEPIVAGRSVWHTETDRGAATLSGGALTSPIAKSQLLSFRLFPASLPPGVMVVASEGRAVETGKVGSFTISRLGATTVSLDVPYTIGGTATPGTDYQALTGLATIPAGASSVTIDVVPRADVASEPDETITLTLTPQAQYLLTQWSTATVTLVNAATPPPPTQVAFAFNEGSGSTTRDAGATHTGTLQSGTQWTAAGRYGAGLNFDGVDDHVVIPDAAALDLGRTGTVEVWVKLDTLNRWHGLLSKGSENFDPMHNYALQVDNGNRFVCVLGDAGNALTLRSGATAVTGRWYHVACVWDGATATLYLDGTLTASAAQSLTPAVNSQPLYIGQFGSSADRLDGMIDEVRIYNRALSRTEVQTDMNTPIGSGAPPDTTPPSAPGTLSATAAGSSQINLAWGAATDNVGVTAYLLERCQGPGCSSFAQIASATGTTFNNTGLTAGTSYSYRARAADAAGNPGPYSNVATTSTQPPPDTTPPTAPGNLVATAAGSSQINLAWGAASDNVGVTGYRVERCQGAGCSAFVQITTTTGTSVNNTGLQAGTAYSYRVRATDAAGNPGPYSNVASASTSTSPPTGSGLVVAYAFQAGTGTSAVDGSGHNNHGTLTNGPIWTSAGKYGNAISFDGTDDHVVAADSPSADLGATGTIAAWVKFTSLNRWHGIVAKGNANANGAHNYALELNRSNRFQCIWGNGSGAVSLVSTVGPVIGQFYHVACVWTGTTLQLYVNGQVDVSVAQSLTPAANSAPLYIGQFGGNTDRLHGVIDEVRIYNRALSPAEVQQAMNTPL